MTTASDPGTPGIPGSSTPAAPVPPRPRQRRWLRRLLWTCGIIIVLLILLVLLLPTLISTGPATRFMLSYANDAIQGHADLSSLSVGWFSGTSIQGVKLSDPQGHPVAEIARIDAPGISLLKLIRGNLDLGTITIADVKATLVQNPDGSWNLNQAIAPRHPAPAPPPQSTPAPAPSAPAAPAKPMDLSGLRAALELKNISISCIQPQHPPIDLTLNASARATGLHLLELSALHADIGQPSARGSLDGKISLRNILDDSGHLHLDSGTADVALTAKDLPLDLADTLAKQQGKLTALLGPTLNLTINASGSSTEGNALVDIKSSQLQVQLHTALHNGTLTLSSPSNVLLTLTPQAFAAFTTQNAKPAYFTLDKPVNLDVEFNRASAQIAGPHFNPGSAALDLTLAISDVSLNGGPGIGLATLSGTKGSIKFSGADHSKLELSIASSAAYAPNPATPAQAGQVSLDATVLDLLTPDGQVNVAGLTAQVAGHVSNWPLTVVDHMLGQNGLVVAAVGPTLGVDLTSNIRPDAQSHSASGDLSLTIKSQNVNGSLSAQISSTGIKTAHAPAAALSIRLTKQLLPLLLSRYAAGNQPLQKLALDQDAALTITLANLDMPFGKPPMAVISATVNIALPRSSQPGALTLSGLPTVESLALDGLTLSLDYDGAKQDLTTELHTQAIMPNVAPVPIDVEGELTHFLDAKSQFDLPATTADLAIQIQNLPVALLNNPSLANVKIPTLRIEVPKSTLGAQVTVKVDMPMVVNDQQSAVHAEADLTGLLSKAPRYCVAATIEKFPLAFADSLAQLNGLLTGILGDTLTSAKLSAAPDAKDPADLIWTVSAQTPNLTADLGGDFKPGDHLALRNDKESFVQLTLTPQSLNAISAWMKAKPGGKDLGIDLTEPAVYRLALGQTALAFPAPLPPGAKPIAGALPLDPAKTHLNLTLTNPATTLRLTDTQDQVRLNNLDLAIKVPSLSGAIAVALKSDLQTMFAPGSAPATSGGGGGGAAAPTPQTGSINLPISISGLVDSRGVIDAHRVTVAADNLALKGLPIALVDHLMGMGGLLPAALGPIANATVKANYGPDGGTFDINADSANLNFKVAAALAKDMTLKLRSAPTIELKATPALFTQLAHYNPMLAGIQSADKPLKVTIKPDTFLVPLGAPDSQALIEGATLDSGLEIGQVTMNAAPFTQGLIGLLLQFIPNSTVNNTFHATLSPLAVHLEKGVASTTVDTWLTSTDLVVGTGGTPKLAAFGMRIDSLNLSTKDSLVRIAIPGIMLSQFPYMQTAFPTDYLYEMVQQGPINQIKPDYSGLIQQMALMAGKAQGLAQLQQRLSGLGSNPIVAALVQKQASNLADEIMGLAPERAQQSEIIKRWPNRPTKLPANVPPAQNPPASTPQQPAQPQQPQPPQQPQQPAQPRRPLFPLPRLPGF